MNDQIIEKIAMLRAKARENTLTPDEMKEAIQLLRQGRVAAAGTSAKSKATKASKAPVNSEALLNELEGL